MRKVLLLIALFVTLSTPSAFARPSASPTPPKPPLDPVAPTPPPVPETPERSGLYSEPTRPGMLVQVFVHRPRVTEVQLQVCPDPDSVALTHLAGWRLPAGNWTYQLNSAGTPSSVGRANFPTLVANSFQPWVNALNVSSSPPNLVRGADVSLDRSKGDGKNIIAWGRTSGSALGTTYIRYFPSTGLVVDVDTIMNKRMAWSWQPTTCGFSTYETQDVMTHELGHWYGLDDEYTAEYVDNTMYGYASRGESKKNTLTTGDTQAVQALYP